MTTQKWGKDVVKNRTASLVFSLSLTLPAVGESGSPYFSMYVCLSVCILHLISIILMYNRNAILILKGDGCCLTRRTNVELSTTEPELSDYFGYFDNLTWVGTQSPQKRQIYGGTGWYCGKGTPCAGVWSPTPSFGLFPASVSRRLLVCAIAFVLLSFYFYIIIDKVSITLMWRNVMCPCSLSLMRYVYIFKVNSFKLSGAGYVII